MCQFCSHPDLPKPKQEDVAFILSELAKYIDLPLSNDSVKAAWCGIRPLAVSQAENSGATKTADISRDHITVVGPYNLITVAGGMNE